MTTEKNTENTPTTAAQDNKAVFGPLGKYAVVAVIMVSIIVTTAIMLDKQLNSVDQQIAAIEEEVAEMHAADTATTTVEVEVVATAVTATETTTTAETEVKAAIETVEAAETVVETPTAEVLVAQEVTTAPAVTETVVSETDHKTAQTNAAAPAQFELATAKSSAEARHAQLVKENQARIDAYKAEQKQHMTDMFARIKALESKQLDRYKAKQDGQIERLRQQIAQQQQMIEALVLRNKDLFELRAANVQRVQANREQVLNRI